MNKIIFGFAASMFASSVMAEVPENNFSMGAGIGFVGNDAGRDSDFDASARFSGFAQMELNPNLAFQAGLSQTSDTEHKDSDNTGEYTLTISSSDVFGGVKFTVNPQDSVSFYGRAGLLYYNSELELKESFYGEKPSGSVEEVEEGTGYYFAIGAALKLNKQMFLEGEITHLNRQEYFESSDRSFDMEETGILLGVRYILPSH